MPKKGNLGGGSAHQRAVAKASGKVAEIAPAHNAEETIPYQTISDMDKKTTSGIRLGIEWGIAGSCVIALIAGNGRMSRASVVCLVLGGGLTLSAASFENRWHTASTFGRSIVKIMGILLLIWLGAAFLAYKVWPKEQRTAIQDSPGVKLANDSNGNIVSNNNFVNQPNAEISLNHSSGNAVSGNLWEHQALPVKEEPNRYDTMTDSELEVAVSAIVGSLRAFDKRNEAEQERAEHSDRKTLAALEDDENRYFQDNFLNNCRAANIVLDKRVHSKASTSIRFASVGTTLRSGMLAGISPARNLADYLDQRAMQLRAQSKPK